DDDRDTPRPRPAPRRPTHRQVGRLPDHPHRRRTPGHGAGAHGTRARRCLVHPRDLGRGPRRDELGERRLLADVRQLRSPPGRARLPGAVAGPPRPRAADVHRLDPRGQRCPVRRDLRPVPLAGRPGVGGTAAGGGAPYGPRGGCSM
ncbi:MAG: hypothetical protein AVDCRST_MAG32-2993, partial [uncultured Nocardioides sp.]